MFKTIPNWLIWTALGVTIAAGTVIILRKRSIRLKSAEDAAAAAKANIAAAGAGAQGAVNTLAPLPNGVTSIPAVANPDGTVTLQTANGIAIVGQTGEPPVFGAVPVQVLSNGNIIQPVVTSNSAGNPVVQNAVVGQHIIPPSGFGEPWKKTIQNISPANGPYNGPANGLALDVQKL